MFPDHPSYYPMDEKLIMEGSVSGPFAGYAYSKRMLALQCQNYNSQYGRQYFGIIPCNIYGKNDNPESGRLIPNLIKQFKTAIQNNTEVVINGSGQPLRQFIFADDLAKIIVELSTNYQKTEPLICCGNEEINIYTLVHLIGKILGFQNKIIFDTEKPDGVFKKTVIGSYINNMFKFTSLEEGLKQVLL
jgi:GDP-L-fucose synthase